jgi:hypothetical protein
MNESGMMQSFPAPGSDPASPTSDGFPAPSIIDPFGIFDEVIPCTRIGFGAAYQFFAGGSHTKQSVRLLRYSYLSHSYISLSSWVSTNIIINTNTC